MNNANLSSDATGQPEPIQNGVRASLRTLDLASKAIAHLSKGIQPSLELALTQIRKTSGKVVLTGVGKSSHVAAKIAATLNSTGTKAMHIHAGEALHGDLGAVAPNDTVICLSKSGNSDEVIALLPALKLRGCALIAMTSKADSPLGQQADVLLDMGVAEEACPFDLAPTTSTSLQLAVGDALAMGLMTLSGFQPTDFAQNHPAGLLGKRLTWTLAQLVDKGRQPAVAWNASFDEVLKVMSRGGYGATVVLAEGDDQTIAGIITDGDLRRAMASGDLRGVQAHALANLSPTTMEASMLAADAASALQSQGISQVVVTQEGVYIGMVHLHDFMRHGLS